MRAVVGHNGRKAVELSQTIGAFLLNDDFKNVILSDFFFQKIIFP